MLRSAEAASEEDTVPDGYGESEFVFPEELEKYKDTNPNRVTYSLIRHSTGNVLTFSYDKVSNTNHITEFTEGGEVVKTSEIPMVVGTASERFVNDSVTIIISKREVSTNQSPFIMDVKFGTQRGVWLYNEGTRERSNLEFGGI